MRPLANRAHRRAFTLIEILIVVVILLIYVQNLFGPPPPDERSLAWFALIAWLIPPWGFWIDRTRVMDPA